ncbi:MAG: alpha-(1-_3)-arabinofuranosyltransferase domain-containing protein, partial [Ilumatobacteraceae bacterium]
MTSVVERVRARIAAHATAASVAVLALISYGPALLSSPGRMPADTKLYLYLDPAGLLSRSSSTFEPDQFAGWVPHQQITYLWPSGPWFWAFDTIGVPDWIAHRLWIATVMFAAGTGVLWMSRRLGLGVAAALAAALTYQLSPYLLPYISRTSLLLLPWAGLGWIVGLTVVATTRAGIGRGDGIGDESAGVRWRRRVVRWREPALIALVVATVGSVNATALVLIAPAPVLWLIHATWARIVTWREATTFALRTAGACLLVSLWWVAMLLVQARNGAPVLAYSETLTDVSRNSTGSEVLRSLGYWLFYVRDPYGPATTASLDYLTRTPTMLLSYGVTLLGLAGLAFTGSAYRRFAALLVATGMVLAVGVHPIDSPSPLMSLFATDDESGLALALRSSTRALPMLVLGLALGVASLVAAIPAERLTAGRASLPRLRSVAAVGAALLVAANLATLWRFELVDPVLERDESPPAAWTDSAAALDADGAGARVLQLPGAEFGAFRWGYTVDQPLVGLADRDLVTRDLLPLGSAGAMDLLYALDDRFQEGTIEPESIAPVARLLGADTVWVANDAEFERFRTPRPEVAADLLTSSAPDTAQRSFGEPFVVEPNVPMVDPTSLSDRRVGTPIAPIVLVDVDDAPGVVRAKDRTVVIAGSGDGVVDAAAAGLLTGHELIRYSGSLTTEELVAEFDAGTPLIVTDSNRDRARHWRTSQDVHGHTESGGSADDVLVRTNADQRLDVFETDDASIQTIAVQEGPVTVIASAYGEPFAYLPEHRPVTVTDGNPATAWLVGGHGDPIGERICIVHERPVDSISLAQPVWRVDDRRIDAVRLHRADGSALDFTLTDWSASLTGERFAVDLGGGEF